MGIGSQETGGMRTFHMKSRWDDDLRDLFYSLVSARKELEGTSVRDKE